MSPPLNVTDLREPVRIISFNMIELAHSLYEQFVFLFVRNNIVDKIIYMLEEHSLNLEKLVEKRTEQWIEEKKRTDELLHSMMPK